MSIFAERRILFVDVYNINCKMRNIDWILVHIRGWPPAGGGDLVLGHGGEAGHQSGLGPGQPQQRVEAAPVLHCGGAGGLRVAASSVHVVCQQLRQQPELEIESVSGFCIVSRVPQF